MTRHLNKLKPLSCNLDWRFCSICFYTKRSKRLSTEWSASVWKQLKNSRFKSSNHQYTFGTRSSYNLGWYHFPFKTFQKISLNNCWAFFKGKTKARTHLILPPINIVMKTIVERPRIRVGKGGQTVLTSLFTFFSFTHTT